MKQKEQYESSLDAALEALEPKEELPPDAREVNLNDGKLPWVVAFETIDAVRGIGIDDSGGVGDLLAYLDSKLTLCKAWTIYSAWEVRVIRISDAYIMSNSVPFKDFREGLQIMAKQREIEHGDQVTILGEGGVSHHSNYCSQKVNHRLQAVQAISNGVLKDERVFAIQPQEWLPKFHRQSACRHHP